jgi:hypothetical protein
MTISDPGDRRAWRVYAMDNVVEHIYVPWFLIKWNLVRKNLKVSREHGRQQKQI